MNYWLVKSEPLTYSFERLLVEKHASWDGVRNYAARLHLKGMKLSDLVLVYHSGEQKAVVGLARVKKEFYQDPTDSTGEWVAIDLIPVQKFIKPVPLQKIKQDAILKKTMLVKIGRLSVMPLSKEQFERFLELGS